MTQNPGKTLLPWTNTDIWRRTVDNATKENGHHIPIGELGLGRDKSNIDVSYKRS